MTASFMLAPAEVLILGPGTAQLLKDPNQATDHDQMRASEEQEGPSQNVGPVHPDAQRHHVVIDRLTIQKDGGNYQNKAEGTQISEPFGAALPPSTEFQGTCRHSGDADTAGSLDRAQ